MTSWHPKIIAAMKVVAAAVIALVSGMVFFIMADFFIPSSRPIKTTILEATKDHVIYRNEFIRNKKCKSQIDRFIYHHFTDKIVRIHRDSVPGDPTMIPTVGVSRISNLNLVDGEEYELRIFITLFCAFVTDQRGYPPVMFRVQQQREGDLL